MNAPSVSTQAITPPRMRISCSRRETSSRPAPSTSPAPAGSAHRPGPSAAAVGVGEDAPEVSPRAVRKLSRRASKHAMTRALKEHVERPGDLPSVLENMAGVSFGKQSLIMPQTASAIAGAFGGSSKAKEDFVK